MHRLPILFSAALAVALCTARPAVSGRLFSGTWCVGHEGLVITFIGKDSIQVKSLSDTSINGQGTYVSKGQTLTATMHNKDVELKMGYRFQARPDSTIRAKIDFFTVNGDSVNHPKQWLRMKRCNPGKGIIPKFEKEEGDTNG
jgi:hypothetical protein